MQAGLHDAFVEKLTAHVAPLTVGDGQTDGVGIGPLINGAALAKVEDHIADACAQGAAITTGGTHHALVGTFFHPTVLFGMTPTMNIARARRPSVLSPRFGDLRPRTRRWHWPSS